jgi:hypothetical protein
MIDFVTAESVKLKKPSSETASRQAVSQALSLLR